MRKFKVIITEMVDHAIIVEAENSSDATTIAYDMFTENEEGFEEINWETSNIEAYEV